MEKKMMIWWVKICRKESYIHSCRFLPLWIVCDYLQILWYFLQLFITFLQLINMYVTKKKRRLAMVASNNVEFDY